MKIKLMILMMLILSENVLFGQVGYNEEFKLIQADGNIRYQKMINLTDGKFAICWSKGSNLFCQVFTNLFTQVGETFLLSNNFSSFLGTFDVVGLDDGIIVVCWANKFSIFYENGIKIIENQIYDINNSMFSCPVVEKLPENNFIIVWQDSGTSWNDIFGKIYNKTGQLFKDEYIINEETGGNQLYPAITSLSNGNVAVTYYTSWGGHQIKTVILDRKGDKVNNEISVEGWVIGKDVERNIQSVSLPNGNFAIVWGLGAINSQIIDNEGNLVGEKYNQPVYCGLWPVITSTNDDQLFVVFQSGYYIQDQRWYLGIDGQGKGIGGQLLNSSNKPINVPFSVNNYKEKNQVRPDVITLSNGNILVTWIFGSKINAKIYKPNPLDHELIDIKLIIPTYDATLTTTTPYFEWNRAIEDKVNFPWEVYYDLYISKDENFTDPFVVYSITDTTYNLKKELDQQQLYYWKVLANTYYGDSLWSLQANGFYISAEAVTDIDEEEIITTEFSLHQNYPNPFNPSTMISYQLPMSSEVRLVVYNMVGEEVATLVNENQQAGNYSVNWDATGLSSGIYFYRLVVGNPSTGSGQGYVETKKMIYCK